MTEAGFKRPESVLVVVYTRYADVLMLRRVSPDDFWQSVTGSLHDGESPLQAARRELAEETGIEANISDLVDCDRMNRFTLYPQWRHRYAPGVTENREYVFTFLLPETGVIVLNPQEHIESVWMPRARALVVASSPTNRAAIADFVQQH